MEVALCVPANHGPETATDPVRSHIQQWDNPKKFRDTVVKILYSVFYFKPPFGIITSVHALYFPAGLCCEKLNRSIIMGVPTPSYRRLKEVHEKAVKLKLLILGTRHARQVSLFPTHACN